MTLGKTDLLSIKLKTSTINIDGVGDVRVRELTAEEHEAYAKGIMNSEGVPDYRRVKDLNIALVIIATIDDDDNQVFSPDDIQSVRNMPNYIVREIADEVRELSGITKKKQEQKNGLTPNGNSSLD